MEKVKMLPIESHTHFIQINLSDLLIELGEDETKSILSSFSCPLNKDVEEFLKFKAVEFAKRDFSKTHLVFWETDDKTEKELIGYYTIAPKVITIEKSVVSSKLSRKLKEQNIFGNSKNQYTVSAPLIGQLGKNFANGNNTLISGDELLKLAIDKVKSIQYEIGGKFVYLECEDNEKLKNFYQRNNFKIFGTRNLDRDETNIKGDYLVQLFAML